MCDLMAQSTAAVLNVDSSFLSNDNDDQGFFVFFLIVFFHFDFCFFNL